MPDTNHESPLRQGIKFDEGKVQLHLLPFESLAKVAQVLEFGAKRYGNFNWSSGIKYSRLFSACLRHLFAWWRGQTYDSETGITHLAHAACCILFLLSYEHRFLTDFDDRPGYEKP